MEMMTIDQMPQHLKRVAAELSARRNFDRPVLAFERDGMFFFVPVKSDGTPDSAPYMELSERKARRGLGMELPML